MYVFLKSSYVHRGPIFDKPLFIREIMKKSLEQAGYALLYLPPYPLDLIPSKKWAQAKARRRKFRCSISTLFRPYT